MHPFGVLDAAAIGPVAADHVTAIDRAGEAARHAVAGDGDVRTAGEDLLDALVLDVDGHGGAFHVVADDAPADRRMGVGQAFDHGHGVVRRQLRAAHRLRKQHGVDAGLAQRGDHVVGQVAERFGLVRLRLDHWKQLVEALVKLGGRDRLGRLGGALH